MIDPVEFGKAIGAMVRDAVADLAKSLGGRIDALEAKAAETVTVTVNEPVFSEEDRQRIEDHAKDCVSRAMAKAFPADSIKAFAEEAVAAIPKPQDGKSVSAAEVMPALLEAAHKAAQEAVAAIPAPKDGHSVTVEDVAPLLKAMRAEWELDFERRALDFHQRMLDRLPKPRDGVDGKDAVPVEDFELSLEGRNLTVSLGSVTKTIHVPATIYRGVFKDGEAYDVGDLATFGGSLFHCNEATTEKPETGKAWTLAAKRGRDGKDGKGLKGDKGDKGDKGADLIRPRMNWE